MTTPTTFADFVNWPSDEPNESIDPAFFRLWHSFVYDRLAATPDDWEDKAGQILVTVATEDGFAPVAEAGNDVVKFGTKGVAGFLQHDITIASPVALTNTDHLGGCINMSNSSSAVITVALDINPAVGVLDRFVCQIRRLVGAAAVQIVAGTGITVFNADGHTRITEGGLVQIKVLNGIAYFEGRTET